jgi:hypothetical protein
VKTSTAGGWLGFFCWACCCSIFPLLSLFNRPEIVLGVPVLYLYLFITWSLIIFLTLIISRSQPGTQIPDNRW